MNMQLVGGSLTMMLMKICMQTMNFIETLSGIMIAEWVNLVVFRRLSDAILAMRVRAMG